MRAAREKRHASALRGQRQGRLAQWPHAGLSQHDGFAQILKRLAACQDKRARARSPIGEARQGAHGAAASVFRLQLPQLAEIEGAERARLHAHGLAPSGAYVPAGVALPGKVRGLVNERGAVWAGLRARSAWSLKTVPSSGSFCIAPVGQLATQSGSAQWLHACEKWYMPTFGYVPV